MNVTREMVLAVADWAGGYTGTGKARRALLRLADRVWPSEPPEPPSCSHWGMFPE